MRRVVLHAYHRKLETLSTPAAMRLPSDQPAEPTDFAGYRVAPDAASAFAVAAATHHPKAPSAELAEALAPTWLALSPPDGWRPGKQSISMRIDAFGAPP